METIARKFLALAAAVSMTVASPAAAAENFPPAPYEGVWQGTIGNLQIRACFSGDERRSFGAYFYMSKLVTIPLIKGEGATQFSEGGSDDARAPRWNLTRAADNSIVGVWTKGAKTLPLRLSRIVVADDDMPCASMTFHKPRLSGLRILRSRATKDGIAYTKLALDHRGHFPGISLESFQLDGNGTAVRRINAVLAKPFGKTEDGHGWLGCVTNAFAGSALGADFGESYEPRLISQRWLSVIHLVGGYCGGAHPDSSSISMLFDRTSGAQLHPLDWFTEKAVSREDLGDEYGIYTTLKPALVAVILRDRKPDDSECYDATRQQESWDVGVDHGSLIFSPHFPHVISACGDEYRVPFGRLQPWLTEAGKKIFATLPR
ncbi:MAG: hypothetical protein HOP96_00080 [Sphingomonas sp.]|nr:hypothetical protein [Sphingomonas sp.]